MWVVRVGGICLIDKKGEKQFKTLYLNVSCTVLPFLNKKENEYLEQESIHSSKTASSCNHLQPVVYFLLANFLMIRVSE